MIRRFPAPGRPGTSVARPIFSVVLLVIAGPALADQSEARRDPRSLHREVPDDPPAARPVLPDEAFPPSAAPVIRGTFQSVQVNVNSFGNNIPGDAANEPSIAVDPTNPDRMVIGWRQFDSVTSNFRQAGWAYSHDAGQTWTFPGVIEPGVFRSDPVLDSDHNGNFFYFSLTTVSQQYLVHSFKSTNGGVSWQPRVNAGGGDKEWMAIDKTNSIGRGHIYHVWSPFYSCCPGFFTRSTNGGASFMTPITIPEDLFWGTIAIGPEGQVYVSGIEPFQSDFVVTRSTNARNAAVTPSFDFVSTVDLGGEMAYGDGPNPGGLLGQVWVATDVSNAPSRGNVYLLCSADPPDADPLDVMFARSTDGGLNWSNPVRVNDDPSSATAWQWFGTISVAPSGRIDVIFNDTRYDPTVTFSELFYAYSTDAGNTWSDNIALTPPWNHFVGYPMQNKIGDYYHMVSDQVGARIAYAATFNNEQDVYFLHLKIDCNNNGFHDGDDIASGRSPDVNGNGIPDECEAGPCGDFDGDGDVDLTDFTQFQLCFGGSNNPPAPTCPPGVDADCDNDGDVDLADFIIFQQNFTGSR